MVERSKIHTMLDQLEQEINAGMMTTVRFDICELQRRLRTLLESLTTLDCGQIDDIVAAILLALCEPGPGADMNGEDEA